MNSILYPACAVAALIAFLYKLHVLRTDRSVTQLFLLGNFFLQTIVFTVSTPLVWLKVSQTVEIVNFSGLFTQGCVILITACQQVVLLSLSNDPKTAARKARPRLLALGLVLAAMITLFSMATFSHENPTDFALTKAQLYPSYLLVYLVAYGISQVDVQILCLRYSKIAPKPWLRRGLRLVGLTMPFVLTYTLCRVADVVAGQLGVSGQAWEPIAQWSVVLATVINVIGWTLPDWGRHVSTLWQALDTRRAYRELKVLHASLTAQIPEPVLPLNADAGLRARLYRRMVEIRDAQWALRHWMSPALLDSAEEACDQVGLTGSERAAAIEAALLRAAVRGKAANDRPLNHDPHPRVTDPQDLPSELRFLRQLAKAFVSSPLAAAEHRSVGVERSSKESSL
ncbi:MAB_1171c family putative transporter [Streptomyces gardneri]|uniref:MAB_1171c family putative transporter n=1 Tax=Streptomyces gardneri TaxID=66892 RepID=UPI0036C58F81